MAYNNSHSVILGQISSYLDRCCRNAYQQGRADALNIDMEKPMHFTDEQKAWVKNYIIINAKRQRADAIEELETKLVDIILGNEEFTDWQKQEISLCLECVIEQLKEQK